MFRPPSISELGRTQRLLILATLALLGTLCLGYSFLPTTSYFWGLGAGRFLIALLLTLLPHTNGGQFRPLLFALGAVTLSLTILHPASLLETLSLLFYYLALDAVLDALVIDYASEEDALLELGGLSASRLLGLWGGLFLQNANLTRLGLSSQYIVPAALLTTIVVLFVLREHKDDRFLPTGLSSGKSDKSRFLKLGQLQIAPALLSLLSFFIVSVIAGIQVGTVLPYPLLHPQVAGDWMMNLVPNLQLIVVGLFALLLLEKLGLRWQVLQVGVVLVLLGPMERVHLMPDWTHNLWGLFLAAILWSGRAVLRELYRLDPILRAASVVSLWTVGNLLGSQAAPPGMKHYLVMGGTALVTVHSLWSFKRYSRPAKTIDSTPAAQRSERFGDRTQDFEGVETPPPQKPLGRTLRRLSSYLLVNLPVTLLLSTIVFTTLYGAWQVAGHRKTWESQYRTALKVFRTQLFLNAFSRRLYEDMTAPQRVPDDWASFLANTFSSDGKPRRQENPQRDACGKSQKSDLGM